MTNRLLSKHKIYYRYEKDIWGLITKKRKENKARQLFHLIILERVDLQRRSRYKSMFYRVDIVKPRRKTKPKTKYYYKLAAKQELSLFYGKIKAYQFKKICLQALHSSTDTMKTIFGLFERRIDAVLFRMGVAYSIFHIRQLIAHGIIYVNDKPIKSPNYILTNYDLLTIDPKWRHFFLSLLHERLTNEHILLPIPFYLEVNYKTLSAMFLFNPRASLVAYPIKIDVKKALSLYFK